MAAKQKFYVVWQGRKPGLYRTWADCEAQVKGFPNARYKAFDRAAEAEAAFKAGYNTWRQNNIRFTLPPDVITPSVSVDAACDGSPGNLEYRGVDTVTGRELFREGPLSNGTNNLGEFLAIVQALAYLQQQRSAIPIYSDSRTALSWVRNRRVGSKLPRTAATEEVWSLADRALAWLKAHSYPNPLLKWDTGQWGEIRADFGRK